MAELEFEIVNWLAPPALAANDGEAATLGALRIVAGGIPLTEVDDDIAKTVRTHVHVPMSLLAEWLLANWWRLRWEGEIRGAPSLDFRRAHGIAAAGGGNAWPPLRIDGDGEFVYLRQHAEPGRDAAAIRYLRDAHVAVAAVEFEAAVDRFSAAIEARLAAVAPAYRVVADLRAELAQERATPRLAARCRWQARAGIDPGDATDAWLDEVAELSDEAGPTSTEELLSALPELKNARLGHIHDALDGMKQSSTALDLTWVKRAPSGEQRELPWQRGARLAGELRIAKGLGKGPLASDDLGELVHAPIPLQGEAAERRLVAGGLRNGVAGGRTRIAGWGKRLESQRFFVARAIAAATVLDADEHVLPILDTETALQKFERSFAQELLCPWSSLDAFTDENGLGAESLVDAAEYFGVSEWAVRSALVNRGKLSRNQLPPPYRQP